MQVQKIQNNYPNQSMNVQKNVSFKAKGDIRLIHGVKFIDEGNMFVSMEPVKKSFVKMLREETEKNLEILRQFKPENIKAYVLELIEFAKGKKNAYTMFHKPDGYLCLNDKPLNKAKGYRRESDRIASPEMSEYLSKPITPTVIKDKEGNPWLVSTCIGPIEDERRWGPIGYDVTPLKYWDE